MYKHDVLLFLFLPCLLYCTFKFISLKEGSLFIQRAHGISFCVNDKIPFSTNYGIQVVHHIFPSYSSSSKILYLSIAPVTKLSDDKGFSTLTTALDALDAVLVQVTEVLPKFFVGSTDDVSILSGCEFGN
jgi:hypothetical protein